MITINITADTAEQALSDFNHVALRLGYVHQSHIPQIVAAFQPQGGVQQPLNTPAPVNEPETAVVAEPVPEGEQRQFPDEAAEAAKRQRKPRAKKEPETVEATTAPAAEPAPEPAADAPALTIENLRDAFTRIYGEKRSSSRESGQKAIMAVLAYFGAKKASDVKAEDYATAIALCDAWTDGQVLNEAGQWVTE